MSLFFYSTHTLYAKVLIPLIIKLIKEGRRVFISKNRFDFLRYSPRRYENNPISNRIVNRSSFDYVAKISGYADEWDGIKKDARFTFLPDPKKYETIIGTTKDLNALKIFKKRYPDKKIFAIGYQHMPFIISLNGKFKKTNLPEVCIDIFTRPNPFSQVHKFPEYISDLKISFRGFPYLEKIYKDYYLRYKEKNQPKRYVLVFHPGGYRGVITEMGEDKRSCYKKQKDFLNIVCGPILERGLIPVIKIHPQAARYHFKEDVLRILDSLTKKDKDFSKIIVEENNYYKYVYESDTILSFGSSSIYELFSIRAQNLLILNFLGKSRSDKFSFMKGIFIDSRDAYNNFWKKKDAAYFTKSYREDGLLNRIYESYSILFREDISTSILKDTGLI